MALVLHFFNYAETYAVLFAWCVIPLAFYESYLFMKNHYGLFSSVASGPGIEKEE